MQRVFHHRIYVGKSRLNSFTLVELLVVMAIIGILVAITLAAASGVMAAAARARAHGEIQAMTAGLESYKSDNGAFPQSTYTAVLLTNSSTSPYGSATTGMDGSSTAYMNSSETLYLALSGQTNFLDTPVAGTKVYMSFKVSQIGNPSAPSGTAVGAGSSYIQDPWTYSYGYSTGTTASYPYNGNGFFDLWSTAGLLAPAATNSAAWIANWQ